MASTKIGMLGAGSWGTALAISLASQGHRVTLWARRPEAAEVMRRERHNPTYLPEAQFPETVHITSDVDRAVSEAELLVFAIPTQAIRAVATQVAGWIEGAPLVVSVAKGIENSTLKTPVQVLGEVLNVPAAQIGVLSGPSHAEEVAAGLPTTLVAAAPALEVAGIVQAAFMTPRLRVYVNEDVLGVEIGGAVKNVLAIAAGISDGIGFGDNAKAAIITRGMAEIQRLGLAMGADASTFAGLAGIGDLVVTCTSRHSRNRFLGEQIGRGRTLAEVESGMSMVAEGVRTTASVHELARRHDIEMPITEAVYAILFEGKAPREAVEDLMTRSAKREDWLPEALQGEAS